MVDSNYEYTKNQMKKHLIALEDHVKANTCPDCMEKHLLAIEEYGEEGSTMTLTPEERLRWLDIAEWARNTRKKLGETV